MTEYEVGYQEGKEAYSSGAPEPGTSYQPGSDGFTGFADAFCTAAYETAANKQWFHQYRNYT